MAQRCRGALIFLHGSGDSGPGLREWIRNVDRSFLTSMSEANIKVVFPTAPSRPYTMAGGESLTVWHDRWSFGNDAKEDVEGVDETIQSINRIMDELISEEGLSYENIVVGGFSMGGGVSLCAGLSLNHPIAGVFSMSSWVSTKWRLWSLLDAREASHHVPPVLMIHGSHDGMIDVKWGESTRDALVARGVEVQWLKEMGIDHEPGLEGLTMLSTWIRQLVV